MWGSPGGLFRAAVCDWQWDRLTFQDMTPDSCCSSIV
jgi:hypothetical protein